LSIIETTNLTEDRIRKFSPIKN